MEHSFQLIGYGSPNKNLNIMSNENESILEFDYNLICEYFSGVERQGPGSPEVTIKALSFIDNLSDESLIVDLGCGTGGQTMVLAQHAPGKITGVDLFPKFIDLFNANALSLGLQSRVSGVVGSMDDLPFHEDELDLIWSEGAIYNIGFERGLNEWRKFLKKGGYVALTEACWFTESRPDEIQKFWMDAYPGIDTISTKLAQLQKAGYLPVASFILPENCWTEHFFLPQVSVQDEFEKRHAGNEAAQKLMSLLREEAKIYERFKEFYGYVFFIGKKL